MGLIIFLSGWKYLEKMPKLNTESKISSKDAAFTFKWDSDMRANHAFF